MLGLVGLTLSGTNGIGGGAAPPTGNVLLLENGNDLLLEDGNELLLET